MTHTCCYAAEPWGSQRRDGRGREIPVGVLMMFRGDIDGIRQEERELGQRLETLTAEFCDRYDSTQATLEGFVRGYWREKMREECLPSYENANMLDELGVKVDYHCELPRALD